MLDELEYKRLKDHLIRFAVNKSQSGSGWCRYISFVVCYCSMGECMWVVRLDGASPEQITQLIEEVRIETGVRLQPEVGGYILRK